MIARLVPLLVLLGAARGSAADWERDPIRYSTAPADNPMNRLAPKLADGSVTLEHRAETGHLKSLLAALHVPESSQVLVFTKTSLQRHRIGPATPRALYFNDDVYVGFCQTGDVLEVAAADARLGTAFYTVGQKPGAPTVRRQADNCLLCHGSSAQPRGARATSCGPCCRSGTGSRACPARPAGWTTPPRSPSAGAAGT